MIRVKPLAMSLLVRLAATPGEVVTRETLLSEVWPRRMVNDEVLSRVVADLRTALGDDAKQSRYIETLPKVGYRLCAPVVEFRPPPSRAAQPPSLVDAPPARARTLAAIALSVAVLAAVGWIAMRQTVAPVPLPAAALSARFVDALNHARPLTSDVELELSPRISPDGKQVAFTLTDGETRSAVIVQSISTGVRQTIGDPAHENSVPVFFPDGERVAYRRSGTDGCVIVEHRIATGAERTLMKCDPTLGLRFDLSPDGAVLVQPARTRPSFPLALVLHDIAANTDTVLTAPAPGDGSDISPRFSPDGKRVAFFRGTESTREVWLLELEAPAAARRATTASGQTYGLAWSPDGSGLLVSADWSGFRALNWLDAATGTTMLLGARGARYPDVGNDGKVVYENAQFEANLWRVVLGTASVAPVPIAPSTRYTSQPDYSRDGARILFASNRDGAEGIYVMDAAGAAKRLRLASGYRHFRPHWSADGKSILAIRVAVGAGRDVPQQAIRHMLSDEATSVLSLCANCADVRESGDGKWLYFGVADEHSVRLFRTPLPLPTQGEPSVERLPVPLVAEFQVDGQTLAFTQPGLDGLSVCTLDAADCRRTLPELRDRDRYHWALAGRHVYFRRLAGDAPETARYALADGKIETVAHLASTSLGGGIAVHPGGREMILAIEPAARIDIMIAETLGAAR